MRNEIFLLFFYTSSAFITGLIKDWLAMEESFGAQYALQIALQTLRERCQQFQQRVVALEEENVNLRSQGGLIRDVQDGSLPEVDALKQQVAQLTEQKVQLTSNIQMISSENRRLWSRLSKLTQVNENLGSKLNKINDTLSQHNTCASQNPHTTLIRSKTFTQDQPHIKFLQKNVSDENDKISLELEDISLKLISTIAKEKSELELQCSQMAEIQNSETFFINSFAFAYPIDEVENSVSDEFEEQLNNLKNIKQALILEKEKLRKNINNLETIKTNNCMTSKESNNRTISVSVQTTAQINNDSDKPDADELEHLASWGTPENSAAIGKSSSTKPFLSNEGDKICPMCSKVFHSNCKFSEFQNHVESHFVADSDGISNFEVVP